jgi:hypothetical protein
MLTAQLHVFSRLRSSGAMPLIPLYAFMAWTGTALPFTKYWLAFLYVLQEQELHLPLLQLGLSVAFEIWRL